MSDEARKRAEEFRRLYLDTGGESEFLVAAVSNGMLTDMATDKEIWEVIDVCADIGV